MGKLLDIKNEGCKYYLGNNKQKAKNCENEQEIVKNGFMFNFYSKLIQ